MSDHWWIVGTIRCALSHANSFSGQREGSGAHPQYNEFKRLWTGGLFPPSRIVCRENFDILWRIYASSAARGTPPLSHLPLDPLVPFCYLLSRLLTGRGNHTLFQRTGFHWSNELFPHVRLRTPTGAAHGNPCDPKQETAQNGAGA